MEIELNKDDIYRSEALNIMKQFGSNRMLMLASQKLLFKKLLQTLNIAKISLFLSRFFAKR